MSRQRIIDSPLSLPDGRFVLPGNRFDLLAGCRPEPPEITVVITYFDDQANLDRVLAALACSTHPRSRLQVVVADDGSCRPPALPAAGLLEVDVVRQPDRGFRAAAARNLGASRAGGSVLAFLDGDTIPEPGYLTALTRLPALVPDALVGGRRRHAALTGWSPERTSGWLTGVAPGPPELTEPAWLVRKYRQTRDLLDDGPRSYQGLISATMACARELFTELGGFDASMVGYGGEDFDLAYRAHTAGAVLAHVPDAVAWHDGPEWGVRGDEAGRRTQKNAEAVELARRIPEPTSRGTGQRYEIADVLVDLDVTGWAVGAAVVCLRSVLNRWDCGIRLTGADAARIGAIFDEEPRVGLDPPTAAMADRARVRVTATSPFRLEPAATLLSWLTEQDCGRIEVRGRSDGGEPAMLTATATRAVRRARRWSEQLGRAEPDLLAQLFGAVQLDPADAGITAIEVEPGLPALFGGWG